jgi:hypothetical protein
LARLKAAMKPDVYLHRLKRDHRILLHLWLPLLLPFAGAILLVMHVPELPGAGAHWQSWLDPAFFAFAAQVIVGAFVVAVNRVLNEWDHSNPDSPESATREFYRIAAMSRPRAKRLGALVRLTDEAPPRVQPVYSWLTAAAFQSLQAPREIARYWRALLRGNRELLRRVRIHSIDVEYPCGDVAVATVRMRVTVTRRLPAALSMLIGAIVAASPFVLGPERLQEIGLSFWTAVVAACALGFALGWAMLKLSKAVVERREVELHKLLVRSAHNWRLVSPEWESEDEADLTWLDAKLLS